MSQRGIAPTDEELRRQLLLEAEALARLVAALQPEGSTAGDAARRTLAVIEEWRLSE
jgi:hypothetical protein